MRTTTKQHKSVTKRQRSADGLLKILEMQKTIEEHFKKGGKLSELEKKGIRFADTTTKEKRITKKRKSKNGIVQLYELQKMINEHIRNGGKISDLKNKGI